MPGFVPNVIIGSSAAASMRDRSIVSRAFVGRQLLPARDSGVPIRAFRRERAAVKILERRVVRRDQSRARAAFDRHVADGHALFHRERANGRAGVLEHAARAAADADPRDQGQDDVLRRHAFAEAGRPRAPDNVFDLRCSRHCVASTCSTSLVPMPNASAPNAPCVAVWLSPQTTVMPGCVSPCSGPMTWTMPCLSL